MSRAVESAADTRQPMPVSNVKSGAIHLFAAASFILAGLFLLFSLPFFWNQFRVLRTWPDVQAQVIRSEVVAQPGPGHEQLYSAKLALLYVVGDKAVTAELTSFRSRNYEATAARAREFAVGTRHTIRYDPLDPTQARIGAGWNRRFFAVPLLMLLISASFALIAFALVVAGRPRGAAASVK